MSKPVEVRNKDRLFQGYIKYQVSQEGDQTSLSA